MACASGIKVSPELQQSFSKAAEAGVRLFKLQIQDENLVEVASVPAVGSEKEDFSMLQEHCKSEAAYVCFRLDGQPAPAEWLFILYVPDFGPTIREKMLYASTRETVKKDLGFSFFKDELHLNTQDELTYESYQAKLTHDQAEAPVTADEVALKEEARAERDMSKQSTASVMFPMSDEAHSALVKLAAKEIEVVQLRLDVKDERIELTESAQLGSVEELRGRLPPDEPRFVYFRLADDKLVFLYTCPENSPVKLKMLYSTCKSALVDASAHLGISPAKSLELRDLEDLTTAYINEELNPQAAEAAAAPTITKAARPGRPGGRRLI